MSFPGIFHKKIESLSPSQKNEFGQRRFDVLQLKEFAKLYKKPLDYFVK